MMKLNYSNAVLRFKDNRIPNISLISCLPESKLFDLFISRDKRDEFNFEETDWIFPFVWLNLTNVGIFPVLFTYTDTLISVHLQLTDKFIFPSKTHVKLL